MIAQDIHDFRRSFPFVFRFSGVFSLNLLLAYVFDSFLVREKIDRSLAIVPTEDVSVTLIVQSANAFSSLSSKIFCSSSTATGYKGFCAFFAHEAYERKKKKNKKKEEAEPRKAAKYAECYAA